MSTLIAPAPPGAAAAHAAASYLTLLPVVVSAARRHFRHVRCPDRRQDLVSEVVAIGWLWHLRLAAKGRDPADFAATFAALAARAVNSGRRLCGQEKAKDALSPVCQRRRGFTVSPLPDGSAAVGGEFDDALSGNTRTPVPDQVQFRCDFPRWLARLPGPKRRVAEGLAVGHRTKDVAAAAGLTPGRVSQMRLELHDDYVAFCDGDET